MAKAAQEEWTCRRVMRHGHGGAPLQVVKFSADGKYCMTGGQDKAIVLWNPHRNGDIAAISEPVARPNDPTASAPTAAIVQRYVGQHGGEVVDIAISRDGGRFASAGGGDKCAVVWDIASGNVIRKLFGHDGRLASCAWNDYPGGEANVLVTGGQDKIARLWDLRAPGRDPIQCLKDAHDSLTRVVVEGPPRAETAAKALLMVAPPGSTGSGGGGGAGQPPSTVRIIVSSMDGCVRTYDLRKASLTVDTVGVPIATCNVAHSGAAVLASTFSAGRGGALLLLDRQSASVLNRYTGHSNTAYRLGCCFTSDDTRVVSGSEDGRLCVWETLALQDSAPMGHAPGGGVPAHTRAVSWVEPHPGPSIRAVLTASFDGTAKLWAPRGYLEDRVRL